MIKKDRYTIAEILLRGLIVFAFVFIFTLIIFPFAKGIPVNNIPDYKDIVSIEIYNKRTNTNVILTDSEDIYYTVCCIDFLKTEINSGYDNNDEGTIVLTIEDINGNIIKLSADEKYIYYDGKIKILKNEKIFVEAIEKLYF